MKTVRKKAASIVSGVAAWIWLLVVIVPIYYILITSLKSRAAFYAENPLKPTLSPSLRAYLAVFENDFGRYVFNTVLVTAVSVLAILAVCVMVSYYIVRARSIGASLSFAVILLGLGIPLQAVIVPVYYIVIKIGLYDSLLGIILPSIAFGIPVTVLILVNFMRDIPEELFDSMAVDGASDISTLLRMVVPLSMPAITTVGVYQALQVWNGFLFPLVLTQSSDVRVLTMSLWSYQGEFGNDTPAILAAVTLSAVPILALYIVGRRQLVAGLTAGFGK